MKSLANRLYTRIQDEIVNRLYKWSLGEPAGPVRIMFSPTDRCNLKCLYCTGILIHEGLYPKELIKKENELSKEEWVRIASEGSDLGIIEWDVCGGEPLLRANTLLAMIHVIKKKNPESMIMLSTNGMFLTPKISERLVLSQCDIIQLSIDGSNAETHDFLRGVKGSFEKVTNAGRLLASAKKKFGTEKPIIQVNTVINARNYVELPEIASLAHTIGAEQYVANPMRVMDTTLPFIKKANLELSNEQIAQFHENWKKVKEVHEQLGIDVNTGFSDKEVIPDAFDDLKPQENISKNQLNNFLNIFCIAPFYAFSVDPIGNVGRCPSAIRNSCPINLRTRSLKEIWYGKEFESARKMMLEGKPLGKECEACGIVMERFYVHKRLSSLIGNGEPTIITHGQGNELKLETQLKKL
jgi:MoaA/NifB/PqqE/SkfB family radical SAM enzyme